MTGCFFDIRVFHLNAPSYRLTQVGLLFRRYELEKKQEYGDCVQSIDSASFTPSVFSIFGGIGREATIFYSHLANLPVVCHNIHYSQMLS